GPGNKFPQHHRFMRCMSALADSTHTVQSRDSQRGGKVAVGSTAGCRLCQYEPNPPRQSRGAAIERHRRTGALHGWTIHAAFHQKKAALVARAQRSKLAIDAL